LSKVDRARPSRASQAAHVLIDVFGQVLQNLDGNLNSPAFGLIFQDIDPGGEVRRPDGSDEAAGEPGPQFLGEVADLPGQITTGKDQPLILAHERVQSVADLRLDLLLAA
jgi:hypothetical protein